MRIADRLRRLEGDQRAERLSAQRAEDDAAEFDRIIEPLEAQMPPCEAEEARWGWAIGRQMLRAYPGCAQAFASMHPEDYRA